MKSYKIKPQVMVISIVWGLALVWMLSGCDKKSETIPMKKQAESLPGFPSQFSGRTDAVGSPHGKLPPGAWAASPDGKFLARFDQSSKKVELLEAKTKKSLDVISDGGENDPKAFAFSSDGSQLAVLYHSGDTDHIIQIWDPASKKCVNSVTFTGKAFYQEMIWYDDGRIALLLQWKKLGAVIDPVTKQMAEGPVSKLPLQGASVRTR